MTMRTLSVDATLFDYLIANSLREHPAQAALREATRNLPSAGMQIGPDQGQLMALLVRLIGAKRTLEVGTFTGYSALSVALAQLQDERLVAALGGRYERRTGSSGPR